MGTATIPLERVSAGVGSVLDHQLDAFFSLPARAAEMARDVKWQPLAFEQQLAERATGNAEGAGFDACAIGGMERATYMRVLNTPNAAQAMYGKDEARLRMAWTIGSGAIKKSHHLDCRTARIQRAVDRELADGCRSRHRHC